MDKIDFVLPWVDGSDRDWLALKCKYQNSDAGIAGDPEANANYRYRDLGLLKYWFRGVEHFAPWVNRVFFVTCGQKPDWLDESNPKLRLVNHKDYIPSDYLPTFHSNTIELNLHRLADLSETFVLFNDDMFLLRPFKPEFYFRKGLPVIPCDIGIPDWIGSSNISRIVLNNGSVLRRSMDVRHLIRKNILKFIDVRELGFVREMKNLASFAVNRIYIPGTFGHMPLAHLKSTLEEIWRVQPSVMNMTSRSRFRTDDSVNHWLAAAWNMVSGRFCPANEKSRGLFISLDMENIAKICDTMGRQAFPQICLSDRESDPGLEQCFREVSMAFEKLLPEKSSFEK